MAIYDYRAVFFDLDGTLIDSSKDLSYAINVMSSDLGIKEPSLSQIKNWLGNNENGTLKLVERALSYSTGASPSKQDLDKAFGVFSEAYKDCVGEYSELFPGTKGLLVKLLANNIKLACITNKPLEFTEFLLQLNMVSQFFSIICAGDNVPFKKLDHWSLLHASKELNVDIKDCLMIGGSTKDIAAARSAGCDVFLVTFGYNNGNSMKNSQSDSLKSNSLKSNSLKPNSLKPNSLIDDFNDLI